MNQETEFAVHDYTVQYELPSGVDITLIVSRFKTEDSTKYYPPRVFWTGRMCRKAK